MSTVVILYGPKAAGKTHLARTLDRQLGVYPIDPDRLIIEWIAQGLEPDPTDGWLENILNATRCAIAKHHFISVEATGAWDSDWKLARLMEDEGHKVLKFRINVPRSLATARLQNRQEARVLISNEEANWIWDQVELSHESHPVDLEIDGSDPMWESSVVSHLSRLPPVEGKL
jgi:hypothetical protein